MLGALRRESLNDKDWRSFSKDEGRKAAVDFLDRLKVYKESHDDTPDASCIREFATSLTEVLSAAWQVEEENFSRLARGLPSPSKSAGNRSTKAWWKIFKRSKSVRHRGRHSELAKIDNDVGVVLDRVVDRMNLNEDFDRNDWEKCRLVLINRHGNYQLEVYTPPKCGVPKMSLFCFLIEDVRSTSLLEVPDCDTAFVIKSRSHGEYVFNTDSVNDKTVWINTISQHKTPRIPMSTSMGVITDNQVRSGSRLGGKFSRSRSQTPINRVTSPSNMEPLTLSQEDGPIIRTTRVSSDRRLVQSMSLDVPPVITSPPSIYSHQDSPPSQNDKGSNPRSPPTSPIAPSPIILAPVLSQSNPNTLTTPPIIPPITCPRKISAPTLVQHNINGAESTTPYSEEDEERLSYITVPMTRGHSRHRSYDSSYSHTTEPTSPPAQNSYRIDLNSSNERMATSGHSSAFSSAGNLHDVTRVTSVTPDPNPRIDTSSPLYIETSNSTAAVPASGSYQSWANTSGDVENLRNLSQFLWFHGLITRNNATSLVINGNLPSNPPVNGMFLVRQSESRESDFVLTFNCNGRAKHLRFTLDPVTGCFIQHLWFEDAPTMIEYFKAHPIPLDSTGPTDDVVLTTHVDRSASDAIRMTTVINMERIQRTPPRRSRSIHVSSPLVSTGTSQERVRHGNWWQVFSRPTSSSTQSMRSHATVQRTHSANAGSLQEIPPRSRNRMSARTNENNYVSRNYH